MSSYVIVTEFGIFGQTERPWRFYVSASKLHCALEMSNDDTAITI